MKKYDRSSLKTLGSVGEPLNHEAWSWFHDLVGEGRCDLVDSWWQTETGGIAIAPRPSAQGTIINFKKNFNQISNESFQDIFP